MNRKVFDELGSNVPATEPVKPTVSTVLKEKTVRIILDENDNIPPPGLFIGLNGRTFMVKPGHEVDVPIGVVEILDNAIEQRPVISPLTRQCTGWTKRRRYGYQRIAGVREIEARAEDQAAAA